MFTNYSISGIITYDGDVVDSDYKLINITKNYYSKTKTSIKGYYSINIMDHDGIFDTGDILAIEFTTRIDGNDYFNRIYNIVDYDKNMVDIESKLISGWNYNTTVTTTKKNIGLYDLNVATTLYQKIYIEVYYLFNGVYTLVDKLYTTDQVTTIKFNYNGEYQFKAYSISNSRLLSYNEVDLLVKDIINSGRVTKRYIEWE